MTQLEKGQRIRLPEASEFVVVQGAVPGEDGSLTVFVETEDDELQQHVLDAEEVASVEVVDQDGTAAGETVLAGFWNEWMRMATQNARATALATTPLRPYPHQNTAVYGSMLPQPMLRFLLGDEPGTGKTVMAGLYAREAQRLGFVNRMLVVCPAHLVTKWQEDFERFFGGGLRRITADTVRERALSLDHDAWVVSLELAAMNQAVLQAIAPERAGWDLVIFDEAHRLTPSAETFYAVGRLVAKNTPRGIFLTATPHRGDEWRFRALMHLVDPDVFPEVDSVGGEQPASRLKPGSVHFLRRMKEELVDFDGTTRLFKPREAKNHRIPLSGDERVFYEEALDLVDAYFPDDAVQLGRMVYGKRTASSLHSLKQTLQRRRERMGTKSTAEAAVAADPEDADQNARDEAKVIYASSKAAREEKKQLDSLIDRLEKHLAPDPEGSKWPVMVDECLVPNGVRPGSDKQLVVFTEYADTADWLVERFVDRGYDARRYSGRDRHSVRDEVRAAFVAGEFQVIVSTDAGNEGIDLQSANVLVNWDIPWSLVTLEQRMGRIHRVGQDLKVWLYNLIATATREGDAHAILLDNLVTAANELGGKMFDCLSMVGEIELGEDGAEGMLSRFFDERTDPADARRAIEAISDDQLRIAAQRALYEQQELATELELPEAIETWQQERLERINPHIVERYLNRLDDADVLGVEPVALAEEGLFYLDTSRRTSLPDVFTSRAGRPLIATSGEIKREVVEAGETEASRAITLGPAEPAFRELTGALRNTLRSAMFQGGALIDATTVTDYQLFCYEIEVTEGDPDHGGRSLTWPYLVRVDDAGARVVPWEILANLEAADPPAGKPHPMDFTDAETEARRRAEADRDERVDLLAGWLNGARRQLDKLPGDLSRGLDDADARQSVRRCVKQAVRDRKQVLDNAATLTLGEIKRVGWAQVTGRGEAPDPTDEDSESVSMRHVRDLLRSEGWAVSDVHDEGLGYDLLARKGSLQRCVEVKGVWGSAASRGIRLTGNELAKAGLLGEDYWLYVVDNCQNSRGELFGAWRDPANVFADVVKDLAVLKINGSDLEAAKEHTE